MESNVLSWGQALEKGYEPKLYPYKSEHIPVGNMMLSSMLKSGQRK